MAQSRYLVGLDAEKRTKLEQKLLARQTGHCFICDEPIDLVLHKGQLDIDHIDPLIEDGLDAENNFASHTPRVIGARVPLTSRSRGALRSSSGCRPSTGVWEARREPR